MDGLTVDNPPKLEDAVLIASFEGWNDAGDVASSTTRWLLDRWTARRFAWLDPEEFYDFTNQAARPQVSIDGRGVRRITWPENEWHQVDGAPMPRPLLLFRGVEPQMHWRRYTDAIMTVAEQAGVTSVVVVGAFLQDVPHTRPPKLSGTSNNKKLRDRLLNAGIRPSNYEGPTGIVSVLQDACRQRGLASASIWGAVPHYISAAPNPRVMLSVLKALVAVFDLKLELAEVEAEADSFEAKVNSALKANPEVAQHVRMLEQQADAPASEAPHGNDSPLPSGADLVEELERFLRSRQNDQQGEQ
jgi:proteasome assembly chaperone (PAC2) family protein